MGWSRKFQTAREFLGRTLSLSGIRVAALSPRTELYLGLLPELQEPAHSDRCSAERRSTYNSGPSVVIWIPYLPIDTITTMTPFISTTTFAFRTSAFTPKNEVTYMLLIVR